MEKKLLGILLLVMIISCSLLTACKSQDASHNSFEVLFMLDESVYDTIKIEEGENTIVSPTAPTKDGYVFAGWLAEKEYPISMQEDGTYIITGKFTEDQMILNAQWEYTKGLEYTLNQEGTAYSVTGVGTATDSKIVIPATHDSIPVTGIGDSAFSYCPLSSITIPKSITNIGYQAFSPCYFLSSIIVEEGNSKYSSVEGNLYNKDKTTLLQYAIGKEATEFTISKGVTSIEKKAFSSCSNLSTITISEGVTSIGNSAFELCSNLTIYCEAVSKPTDWSSNWNSYRLVVWDSRNNYVADDGKMYYSNKGIVYSVNFNTATVYNAGGSIKTADILPSITINGVTYSVTSIASGAFYCFSNLSSVTIPEGVISIGDSAFSTCTNLSSITIPESVTSIGNSAFSTCTNLSSITIPEGVTSIGNWAFNDCSNLSSITIPESVTNIGDYAFSSCSNLSNITVEESNSKYSSVEGNLYNKEKTKLIQYAIGKKATEFTIPDGVTIIGSYAFSGCDNLSDITIPKGVTLIGAYAFSGCGNLSSVTIPEGVTSIGSYAFSECVNLSNVTIPESVTSIGSFAFYSCSNLISITIPESVTVIESYTFSGCSNLSSVTLPKGLTSIRTYAFFSCDKLSSITIPKAVTSIGDRAFSSCSNLTIYCEAETQPIDWISTWNHSDRPVVWGYTKK